MSGAYAQQSRSVIQTWVSADVHGLWAGEFNKSSTGLSGVGLGCSAGQNVHDPQQGSLTEKSKAYQIRLTRKMEVD